MDNDPDAPVTREDLIEARKRIERQIEILQSPVQRDRFLGRPRGDDVPTIIAELKTLLAQIDAHLKRTNLH